MKTMFVEGGFPMWFIVAFGLVAMGTAVAFAARPLRARERFVDAMARTTLYATIVGVVAALGEVFHVVARLDGTHEERIRMAFEGFGESMAPAIVGFGLLTIVTLLSAVGKARLDAREHR